LGLIHEFNGVSVDQLSDRIVLHCDTYIQGLLCSHGWSHPTDHERQAAPHEPHASSCVEELYKVTGLDEGSPDALALALALAQAQGFGYRILLCELLYAYTTCRPDIGYAVVTLSKFSKNPAPIHYAKPKQVAKYLRATSTWGINYWRSIVRSDLTVKPLPRHSESVTDLHTFPATPRPLRLVAYVDAAHANDLRNRRSTTGCGICLAGGIVACRCKSQSVTATSSTEAEFIAAVSASKTILYLWSILAQLGLPQLEPTTVYEDNSSAINMINHSVTTERSRHIDIQMFAIQDWKDRGDILLAHIPGVINPADALTKALGWVLHSRHLHRLLGSHRPLFAPAPPTQPTT
jgi:hypothetical protein